MALGCHFRVSVFLGYELDVIAVIVSDHPVAYVCETMYLLGCHVLYVCIF